jgi:uncharacterized protein
MRVVDRLGSIQFDPIDVTGRNHDLVLASRVAGYRREWTDRLLYEDRSLFEAYNKGLSLLPTAELLAERSLDDPVAAGAVSGSEPSAPIDPGEARRTLGPPIREPACS